MTRNLSSSHVLRISAALAALALATFAPGCASRSQEAAPNGTSVAPEGQPPSESTLGAQPSSPAEANPTPEQQPQPAPTSAAQPTSTPAAQPTPTSGTATPAPTSAAGSTASPAGGCDPAKEPNREYRMRDPNQCKAALFRCPAGKKAFFNTCGCGCE